MGRAYHGGSYCTIIPYAVFLLENGIQNDMKFVVQEMWDYPLDILPWVIISRCVFTDASIIIVNDFNIFTLA